MSKFIRNVTFALGAFGALGLTLTTATSLAQPAATAEVAPAAAAPVAAAPTAPAPPKMWFDTLAEQPWETSSNFWMPKAVNKAANSSDVMFYAVLGLSFFFFFAISAAVIGMVIKYRHRPGHKAMPSSAHSDAMEITWTVIPTIICVFLFIYGWRSYLTLNTGPTKAVEVQVQAWRWQWEFKHANGVFDENLHVPVNTDVRLVMTARDVLHSFFIPVMRIKQDLIPRRYTYAWFHATKPGVYRLYCTEYCGQGHSQMSKRVIVHEPGGYERYLADKSALQNSLSGAALGKQLYSAKGCIGCHSLDGTNGAGPTWKAMFGHDVDLADGTKVPVDETYLRTAILAPAKQIVKGFAPSMPSYEGQLTEKEISGLIEYMKELK
ncbi:MAG: cytochrome c oxidase subunit II [Kofleriaceae bacterium]|nr:cytochrome c oxidase subunit II [Kofleriaceae bacterium]